MAKRKKPTFSQRTTPCMACGYPLSQQHHIYPVAEYGSNPHTVPLCANCHEVYHAIHKIYTENAPHSLNLIAHLLKQQNLALKNNIVHLCCVVLVVERITGVEIFEATQLTRWLLVVEKFPSLFNANHNPMAEKE